MCTTDSNQHIHPRFVSLLLKRFVALIITNAIILVTLTFQLDLSPRTIDSVTNEFYNNSTPAMLHIPLNGGSNVSIANVQSILHNPKDASITVNFYQNRTCMQPQLIGRLSGLSLSIVEWNYDYKQSQNNSVLVGQYYVPSQGIYFIEIIVTMCQRLTMDMDLINLCLVDPTQHRLTHANATIDAVEIRKKSTDIGVWYNMHHSRHNDSSSMVPLHTRYQPLSCKVNSTLVHCKKHTEIARYDPYKFVFDSQISSLESLSGKKGTLCFVGASHSRVLSEYSVMMGADALQIPLLFISQYTRKTAARAGNCSKIVIGIGQWDLGYPAGHPTAFNHLKEELNRTMVEFVDPLRQANKSVYFRNLQ